MTGSEEPSFPTKKKGDDTSDEEKEWLEALEKGTLDDSGMLKRSKDPKLMTARQVTIGMSSVAKH